MIAMLFALFDARPWPGMSPRPVTMGDVLCALHREDRR